MSRFEVFTECPDYPELFWIGNRGTLFSLRTYQDLTATLSKTGYPTVATKIGGRQGKDVCLKLHVQVAKAFVPNVHGKPFVNHKDGNKQNNSWENLEWVTHLENMIHAKDNGLLRFHRGYDSAAAILTPDKVATIMSLVGKASYRAIARELEVNKETVRRVAIGQTYKVAA